MSKRLLPVGLLIVLVVLAIAGASSAAGVLHDQFKFHGTYAEAEWVTPSATDPVDTYVNITVGAQPQLYVSQSTAHLDGSGNFLGGTVVETLANTGFTASIDTPKMRGATVDASNLPATRCEYDSTGAQIGDCVDTTISVHADWTGEGLIGREILNDRYMVEGFKSSFHFNGKFRNATVAATVNGEALTADNLLFADIGDSKQGEIDIYR